MHCDFNVSVKCTIFWLKRGLKFIHKFNLDVPDFLKRIFFLYIKLGHKEYTKRFFLKTSACTIQISPRKDAFHLNNKVTVHEIILLVQLN